MAQQQLKESLVDTIETSNYVLLERKNEQSGEVQVFVRGEFGRADRPTANKRLYNKRIWESQIDRLGDRLKEKRVLGELDHPDDGRTSLKRVSHVVTDLRLEGGQVVGEALILPTTLGKDLMAMLKAGVPIGVSSRGFGSVKPDVEGNLVVQEDYKLVTFDFVADPADPTAYPNAFFEGVQIPEEALVEDEENRAPQISNVSKEEKNLEAKFAKKAMEEPEASSDTAALRKEFQEHILTTLTELKIHARREVEEELLADPEVARAKSVVESIKTLLSPFLLPEDGLKVVESTKAELAELQKKYDELVEQSTALEEAAKEAALRYYLETKLRMREDGDLVRQLVGDVLRFESRAELQEAIDEAVRTVEEKFPEGVKSKDRLAEEASIQATIDELQNDLADARAALKQAQLQLFGESLISKHPRPEKIRALLQESALKSKAHVRSLVEGASGLVTESDTHTDVRDRVRSLLKRDERPSPPKVEGRFLRESKDYNGLGVPLAELKKLSGHTNS